MKTLLLALMASLTLWSAIPAQGQGLGLQLWSLRQDLQADPAKGLDAVKSYGFTTVESHSTYGLSPARFRLLLDARGLKLGSAHFPYERFDQVFSCDRATDERLLHHSGNGTGPIRSGPCLARRVQAKPQGAAVRWCV